jgi:hypothetical protein
MYGGSKRQEIDAILPCTASIIFLTNIHWKTSAPHCLVLGVRISRGGSSVGLAVVKNAPSRVESGVLNFLFRAIDLTADIAGINPTGFTAAAALLTLLALYAGVGQIARASRLWAFSL